MGYTDYTKEQLETISSNNRRENAKAKAEAMWRTTVKEQGMKHAPCAIELDGFRFEFDSHGTGWVK